MNIDLTPLRKNFWYEDADGNEVSEEDPKACYYRYCFPLELCETLDEFCYHPENPFIKFLCRHVPGFYKRISKGKTKTYRTVLRSCTTYHSGSDCIVAMVNSGDYTLEEAVWVYAHACERCRNALLYKYLDGKDGYEEFSDEWKKANTVCAFCEEYEEKKSAKKKKRKKIK